MYLLLSHFRPFLAPLAPLERSKGSKQCKTNFLFNFENRSEALWSDFGPPKGPPQGLLLGWVHGPEGPSGGPKFLIAPLGRPDGVQGGVNRASGATKRASIQVEVFKTKKRFP